MLKLPLSGLWFPQWSGLICETWRYRAIQETRDDASKLKPLIQVAVVALQPRAVSGPVVDSYSRVKSVRFTEEDDWMSYLWFRGLD